MNPVAADSRICHSIACRALTLGPVGCPLWDSRTRARPLNVDA